MCIFIIDDDPSVREALSLLLGSVGYACELFSSAEEFLARKPFDGLACIVLDIRMSGMSGLDLQEELMKRDRRMPIVFITGHGDIPMTVQAMKKGAVDFIPKPFDDEQLLGAIEAAIAGHREAKTIHDEAQAIQERIRKLTPREYEVFRYVLNGMLNKQIAFELNIAEHTVKIHRGRVMEKLGMNSVADLVRLAHKIGVSAV